jgi:hypothetical protein
MINEIKLYLFVLSLVFILKIIFEFFYELTRENPEPLQIKEIEKIFIYLSLSYVITYILI